MEKNYFLLCLIFYFNQILKISNQKRIWKIKKSWTNNKIQLTGIILEEKKIDLIREIYTLYQQKYIIGC